MKIEISYEEMFQLQVEANTFLFKEGFIDEKGEETKKQQPKIVPAVKNILKQIDKLIPDYNDGLDNLRLDNCVVNEKTKVVLKDEKGNYKFTVEGTKSLKKAVKEFRKEKVEIHQRLIQDSGVDIEEYESFKDILVPTSKEQ